MKPGNTVLVSGCYDILHGGHIQFLRDAAAMGDRLVVSVADDAALLEHKGRLPAMPVEHKVAVLTSIRCVDQVVVSSPQGEPGMDFEPLLDTLKPSILAVTGDDRYREAKRAACDKRGIQYVVLPKGLDYQFASSTEIRQRCAAPEWVPLRVDFAGGWLDVPTLARQGGFIVNCAITPGLSLKNNWAEPGSGLGGSAAWSIVNAKDGVAEELAAGVGWQDPAVITETGLCVWRSGERPELEMKDSGDWLKGLMAIKYLGGRHAAADLTGAERDLDAIVETSWVAHDAVLSRNVELLGEVIGFSCAIQCAEPMPPLERFGEIGAKYSGCGHGGYALYLFASQTKRDAFVADSGAGTLAIEPYCRWHGGQT